MSTSSPPASALHQPSARSQTESDEVLRARLASLPLTTESEQSYAALASSLCESVSYWRARSEAERRRAELATQQSQNALARLMALVASEGDALLNQLKNGVHIAPAATVTSPHGSSSSLPSSSSLSHSVHPSHLSRRVSFNRDIMLVVSPDIGGDSHPVPRTVDEDEEEAADGSSSSSSSSKQKKVFTGVGSAGVATDLDGPSSSERHTRRLSRTEFNEGAILKQHMSLSDLEKEEIGKNTGK